MSPTARACALNQHAERLKAQGNDFHQKGQFKAAYRKYSEAIKEDPKNAVYYANRAASSLAMKEFMDAAHDAKKATELDPTYAKAWGRRGSAEFALAQWTKSIDAWKKALECLPPTGDQDTESDRKLRVQFEEGLRKAEDKSKEPPIDPSRLSEGKVGDMPWDHALALEKDLIAQKKLSSAFSILFAYREYKEGVDAMKCLQQKPINGQLTWLGKPDAIVGISNGVMRDPRVFHIDSSDWIEKYNRQVMFSAQAHKAWNMGGAKTVMESAPARLKNEGWSSVRPALSTTIRAWLMCGLMAKSTGKLLVSLEYYGRVIDVLDWGRRVWHNVPKDDRGAIFQPTFLRGVKRMRLSALSECIGSKVPGCQYTKKDLAEWCHDLISETEANPPTGEFEVDAGFLLSFWIYPKAEALSLLGWCHMQLGLSAESAPAAMSEFALSAKYYIQSADTYPDDEEQVPMFLKVATEAYWFQGKPLKDIIPLIIRIEEVLPGVLRLWGKSPSFKAEESHLHQVLEWAEDVQNGLADGRFTVEDVVKPKEIKNQDKWKTGREIYI